MLHSIANDSSKRPKVLTLTVRWISSYMRNISENILSYLDRQLHDALPRGRGRKALKRKASKWLFDREPFNIWPTWAIAASGYYYGYFLRIFTAS